jgi:ketosteroid isomerase-like protein
MMNRTHVDTEVLRLADAWAATERGGDTEVMEGLLADDFVGVGPRGFMLTKEQWLARYRSGDLKTASLTWDETQVRVYGQAAVVTGRQTSQGTYKGQPTGGQFRTTLVFVMPDGRWQLAGLHLSPIVAAP